MNSSDSAPHSLFWQLYDRQGRAVTDRGAPLLEVGTKGLLHSASHVWVWRQAAGGPEILLQRRADTMPTFPGVYDISAAGHIDLGEDAVSTAVRETKEEIGLDITEQDLSLIGVVRSYDIHPGAEWIENEFNWIYLVELKIDHALKIDGDEVTEVLWKPLAEFQVDLADPTGRQKYALRGDNYFSTLFWGLTLAQKGVL
jgi:isopentenyldiphosphate isomerase